MNEQMRQRRRRRRACEQSRRQEAGKQEPGHRSRQVLWANKMWACLLALACFTLSAKGSFVQGSQSMGELLQVFSGNESQAAELNYLKLMEIEGDSVLVGARNVVYNLSLSTLQEQRRLEWPSSEDDVKMCRVKGKSLEQCQNYIRVLKLQATDTLFVCGTNAYKPRCRTYLITASSYELVKESPGEGACPYQENQNVTSLFVDGNLYSATVAQFSGIDGLIHRTPLRTEQFNPKQLNSPNFVSSFRYGEHVYFLFRESAIEHINCGKTIYSRIARVCINDSGGQTRASSDRWTSFVKARLNCSIPNEFPFYFDHIQASTQVVSSASWPSTRTHQDAPNPQSDLLYALFTTPTNSIGGSAVCAYSMADILAAFDGPFKSQADTNSNWLPVPDSRVPQPRPGTCVNDSKRLPDENINFIKDNPLMDMAVEPIWSQPLVMMASINFRLTQIAVDPQVEAHPVPGSGSMRTDVIFVATDDGRLFKLTNTHHLYPSYKATPLTQIQQPYYNLAQAPSHAHLLSAHRQLAPVAAPQVLAGLISAQAAREPLPDVSANTVVIEELHLFDARTPILKLLIHYPPTEGVAAGPQHPKLLALSGKQIKAVPLSRCERASTCTDCLALYDPYCVWDTSQHLCLSLGRSQPHFRHTSHATWFPANNNTLAWWSQCPPTDAQQPQQVGLPFRSLFSSHLQVPSRYDYSSGHHLSHTAMLSLTAPASPGAPYHRQQPLSECLTFCGGLYTASPASQVGTGPLAESNSQPQLMMNCADYVHQHYIGSLQASPGLQGANQVGNLYTSENLYLAVIICASSGLILGLVFGFAIGKSTRKHDSSICSSTFDETNLYMASTGSHHGPSLFAQQQQQQQQQLNQRLHHPLLQQSGTGPNGSILANGSAIRQPAQHLFESGQLLMHETAPSINYGNQQQMLLHLSSGSPSTTANGSIRSGALPPLPIQSQSLGPLVNTSTSSTHINHNQLTPNQLGHQPAMSGSSASSTNTSSTSATMPVNDHHQQQMYLNQQQLLQQQQQQQHQQQTLHQRSFTASSATSNSSTGKGSNRLVDSVGNKISQLQPQQNNKIYL